jgi:hypothetical protein
MRDIFQNASTKNHPLATRTILCFEAFLRTFSPFGERAVQSARVAAPEIVFKFARKIFRKCDKANSMFPSGGRSYQVFLNLFIDFIIFHRKTF